jgi:hypothetical protein
MVRALVAAVVLVLLAASARADTVALLPLDGEKRLEIYGQPVAAELGRALQAAGVDVVIVSAKMDVPQRAQLIVDGTIKADKNNAITLSLRIRDPKTGSTLESLPASAATLTTIDKAAAELSAKVVPAVKTHLAELAKATTPPAPSEPVAPPPVEQAPPPPPPTIATTVTATRPAPVLELLATGLRDESRTWARRHAGAPAAGTELALDVLRFAVTPGDVPLGRARVRATIRVRGELRFDRVIVTDTIVGDKGISGPAMAARTAREVLAIANAQLRRIVTGWR